MRLSIEQENGLQDLLAKDEVLVARVQAAADVQHAAAVLSEAAAASGLLVSTDAVLGHIQHHHPAVGQLCDAQLDAVAGGNARAIWDALAALSAKAETGCNINSVNGEKVIDMSNPYDTYPEPPVFNCLRPPRAY